MSDLMARMGELVVSGSPTDTLVALGLGSCIGLVLMDRRKGVAGLAHIVLPGAEGHTEANPLKFADNAVPELIARVAALGARTPMLEAVLAGGASMFAAAGSKLEVGSRKDAAVRAQLERARIRVAAAATGGTRGRTVRVTPDTGIVTVRIAGSKDEQLYPLFSNPRILQEVA